MAAPNPTTIAQMNGLYKEAYAEGIVGLIPDPAYLVKNIMFGEAERVGNLYHQPVILTREAGMSYNIPGAGAYPLAPAVPMTMKDAQLQGSQTTLRSQVPYDTVARSIGNAKAFKKATLPIIEMNLESHAKRLELLLLYGQSATGLGQTQASGSAVVDGTHEKLQITAATWAVGIWAGEEGSKVSFYRDDTNALVGGAGDGDKWFTVSSIDPDNKTITVVGTSAGCTALHTADQAAALDIYFYGTTGLSATDNGPGQASSWSTTNSYEMAGIDRIAINNGTLFNIPANTYTLWKSSTYSASSGQLTMAKIISAVNKAVGKGGLKEKVVALVYTDTWPNLMTDLAALRMFDDSYQEGEVVNGFETIRYIGANGEIEVVPHSCVKGGEAFIAPLKRFKRVGATEITFNTPGRGDEIFLQIPDYNGFEMRSYADQAVICTTPAKCVKITNIVNV
jgi:hypothetical protein